MLGMSRTNGADPRPGRSSFRPRHWAQAQAENPLARFVPFSSLVSPHDVITRGGDYLRVWRLDGVAFECADEHQIGERHEALCSLLRNLAGGQWAVWTHRLHRVVSDSLQDPPQPGFARDLSQAYQAKLGERRMMSNELYLTLVYRPNVSRVSRALQSTQRTRAAIAEAQADAPAVHEAAPTRGSVEVGWLAPEHLDIDAVARLRSQTLQMPLPWVFDWHQLKLIDAEAAMQLSALFRSWSGQSIELRWMNGERLFQVLAEAAPTGVRDADPAFWLTRLDALRLANRPDQFDEAAIDYCVTYEVSPPSWEPTRCKVQISSGGQSTRQPDLSLVSDVSTGFMESGLLNEGSHVPGQVEVAHVELSGQLIGDIGATLAKLQSDLTTAPVISVSCSRLIRVDFIAAGDLLNWVLSKRSEGRAVQFVDTHRLVALFFGAMGINEHAKVQVRKV